VTVTRPSRLWTWIAFASLVGLAMVLAAVSMAGSWRVRERWRSRELEREGQHQLAMGDRAAAYAAFEASTRYRPSPDTIQALRRIGNESLARHGEERTARDAFALLCRLDPVDPEAWFALGTAEAASAGYVAAAEAFGRAVRLRPTWLEADANRGICLVWAGEPARAREVLGRVMDELPKPPPELLCALGRAELERVPADLTAARSAFRAALAADARCSEACLGLALAADLAGEAKEREAQLAEAKLLDPNSADVLVTSGALHARAGDDKAAREDLSLALVVAPHHPVAHYDLGCLYLRQRDGRKAEAQFRAAVESSPEDPLARLGWALALRLEGRAEEAEKQLMEALRRRPVHAAVELAQAELRALQPPDPEAGTGERMSAPESETPESTPRPRGRGASPASPSSGSTTPRSRDR
jgi:tetratricopeptide (TPR) repeat protein